MDPATRTPARIAAGILVILFFCTALAGCTGISGSGNKTAHTAENNGKLSVCYLDVGQGDSELLVFDNKTILIDAGETDMGGKVVADLKRLGVTRIDLLVATHPHSDHIGGMDRVLAAFPVGRVVDTGLPSTSPVYEQFLKTIEAKKIPYTLAEQGQTLDLDPALRILVLSPPAQRFGDDPNANSIVLRISYGTVNFLFTGDIGGEAEDALAKTGYPLDAQILKLGHHGSEYSSSPAFLARVHPETAIIEVGKDNPYGHPHAKTLRNLEQAGAAVYRTDRDGTVLVRTDGNSYMVRTEKGTGGVWERETATPATGTPAPTGTATPARTPAPADLSLTIPAIPANATIPVPSFTLPPVQIGNASSVYISAARFDAPGDDRENLNGEWIRIANRGEGSVLLAGWTLSDKNRAHTYRFPALLLQPRAAPAVYSGSGMMNDTALFMNAKEPVWGNSGDLATLSDGSGAVVSQSAGGTA